LRRFAEFERYASLPCGVSAQRTWRCSKKINQGGNGQFFDRLLISPIGEILKTISLQHHRRYILKVWVIDNTLFAVLTWAIYTRINSLLNNEPYNKIKNSVIGMRYYTS